MIYNYVPVLTSKVEFETKSDVCLIPNSSALTVIFPKSNSSADGSCICNQWLEIEQCSCLTKSNFFEVYNEGEAIKAKICWKNLKNHTRIHFVVSSNNTDAFKANFFPPINQVIMQSYEIIIISKFFVDLITILPLL